MKKIFTPLLFLFFAVAGTAQTTWYVNDGNTAGDVFTSATGNNANPGTASSPFATLDYALTKVQNGDTVFVDAGSYTTAGVTISKSVTILGANYAINPNSTDPYVYNSSRNAESVITGGAFFLGADNITFKGLRFTPTDAAISAAGVNRQNITIENNYFDVMLGAGNYILFRGASVNPLVASGLNVVNNRFVKTNGTPGTAGNDLAVNNFKNINITGNSFIETGATTRLSTAIISNSSFMIDGALIENNYFRNMNFTVRIFASQNVTVRRNLLDSSGRGIGFFYGTTEQMKHITVDSNIINNDRGTQPILFRWSGVNAGLEDINITNNIINQGVDGYTGGGAMIQLEFGSTGLIGIVNVLNNKVTVSGNYDNAAAPCNFGVMITGNHHLTNISGNEFNFTAINARQGDNGGVYANVPTGIYFNTDGLSPFFGTWGPIPANAEFHIDHNKFNGFKNAISFFDPSTTGITPYTGYGGLTPGADVRIEYNSFLNDSIAVDNGSNSYDVSANCNWWGVYKVQDIVGRFSMGTVNPLPWLTDGTDTDPLATGFQPADNTCNGQPPVVVINQVKNVSCKGSNNGSINVTTTGGFAPFTYEWTKQGDPTVVSTNEDVTGLAPGRYHLKVTDTYGSELVLNATGDLTSIDTVITEPAALTATATGTNNLCNAATNGTALVTVTGGTAPYSIAWSNGATTENLSDLSAGIYSVTVTDANGCTATASYEVTEPTPLNASVSGTNVLCKGGSTGSANIQVTGGAGNFTYLWSNGELTSSIANLAAGNYTVTAMDGNGCSVNQSIVITEPLAALTASVGTTDVSCYAGTNGTAGVNATGGTAPYTYLWNDGSLTSSISGLSAGAVSVTVTDANGCSVTVSGNIGQPLAPLAVSLDITNVSCNGGSNGAATTLVTGGTAPYAYLWSNGATSANLSGLTAGGYSVAVTDAHGCTSNANNTITEPTALSASTQVVNNTCFNGNTGSITVTANGGSPAYAYSINGVDYQPGSTFINLPANNYTVYIKDNNVCTTTSAAVITQPTAIVISFSGITASCSNSSTGAVSSNATGGTGLYTYNWTGPNGYTKASKNISNLSPGDYTLTVTDANGCTKSSAVTIPAIPAINLGAAVTDVACYGSLTGAINITATGGSGGSFTYSWTGPNGFKASTEDILNQKAGSYSVSVKDPAGCTLGNTYTIAQPAAALSLGTAKTDISACGGTGSITATASGGTAPYSYKLNAGAPQSSGTFNGLSTGTYTVAVTDSKGCTASASVSIADNGNDAYESNNKQNNAAAILVSQTIQARIAPTATDVDWYKFSTGASAASYTVTVNHASVTYTFNLYDSKGKLVTPTSSTATTKTYGTLTLNTTYSIQVSGALSYNCYSLQVSSGSIPAAAAMTGLNGNGGQKPGMVVDLQAKVYPNPNNGVFNIAVTSSEGGPGVVEILNNLGQIITQKKVSFNRGGTTIVNFNGLHQPILYYRVIQGNQVRTGKILGSGSGTQY